MPPETNTAKAPAPAVKVDYAPFVGKYFTPNHKTGLNANATFKVLEFVPDHNFGSRGGKKPAFKLHRMFPGGVHWEPCEEFVKNHVECEYVE
jgi:hypothetical protein